MYRILWSDGTESGVYATERTAVESAVEHYGDRMARLKYLGTDEVYAETVGELYDLWWTTQAVRERESSAKQAAGCRVCSRGWGCLS